MKQVVSLLRKLFGLKPKMYPFLVDDSNVHKKAKSVNKMLLKK